VFGSGAFFFHFIASRTRPGHYQGKTVHLAPSSKEKWKIRFSLDVLHLPSAAVLETRLDHPPASLGPKRPKRDRPVVNFMIWLLIPSFVGETDGG
jgi:hypothetical protein